MDARPVQIDVYRTAIPMRRFEHAAASRDLAEAVVVRIELSDGAVGWGETHPRDYVTGETVETVRRDVEGLLWPAARAGDAAGRDLPSADGDRAIPAARCAVELALYDASGARPGGRTGARRAVRFSGVLGSADPARTARRLRLMRLYGLRDFKLKLGFDPDVDAENLRLVHRRIGRALRKGRCTLRADVNGRWPADETPARAAALRPWGVCLVEQPVCGPPEVLIDLAQSCELPLMADESLITAADAQRLINAPGRKVWLNIRLSKNGGFWPALGMARAAARAGVPFTVGCMVGESSLLSAAQRRLLQACPKPRFAEGNYGRLLLGGDLTTRSIRFGYGGRWRPLPGAGLGVSVDPDRLRRYGTLLATLRA